MADPEKPILNRVGKLNYILMETEKPMKTHIINALIHFLYNFFVYFIFLTPLNLWVKATKRLSKQRESEGLSISKITGLWPFLSFLKRFVLDFLIDGLIFMSYILAPLIFIVSLITGMEFIPAFTTIILGSYFVPLPISIIRDLLQLLILPFKKFLSWASKPAQYMDLEIKNK